MTEQFFLNAFGIFVISLVRFTGFFINLPVFGETIVPLRVKAGLSGLCALLLLPHLSATQQLPELSILEYGLMVIKELVLGLTIGFIVLLTIDAFKFAGEIIGMQIGFSFIQVVDPESNRGQAIVSEFMQVLCVLTFLILNGHLILLNSFVQSFNLIPLAGMKLSGGVIGEIMIISSKLIWIGIQLSMPILAVILIGDVALGIIARTVPRLNVFQVGFALKILGGLFTIILTLPFYAEEIKTLISHVYGDINNILNKL